MNNLNVLAIQHVPFEKLGHLNDWIEANEYNLNVLESWKAKSFPDLSTFDLLIVLGGPMGAYEEDKYPWLKQEKKFVKEVISANKKVIGICLGSQIIAEVLGGKVYKSKYKEIGWFPINKVENEEKVFLNLPNSFTVFHWHGDTFDLPSDVKLLASSEAIKNQAFIYEDRVLGLQFHLEMDEYDIKLLIENTTESYQGKYVQPPEMILRQSENFQKSFLYLDSILSNFI